MVSQKFYRVPYEFWRITKMIILSIVLYGIAVSINPSSVAISMLVKFLIALSFPLMLYFIKFYSPEEKARMVQISGQAYGYVKSKLGLGGI